MKMLTSEQKILKKAEKILRERIRPYMHSHGGDVQADAVRDGVLYCTLTGSCSNCSSAWLTVEDLIKPVMLKEIPQLQDVAVENETDEDMIRLIHDVFSGKFPVNQV